MYIPAFKRAASVKKYGAEAIATFLLMFFGTGACIIDEVTHGAVTHAGIAATWGLTVSAMIFAFGDVSGSHMNPVVTVGFWVKGLVPARQVAPYIVSQAIGAFAASLAMRFLFPESKILGATFPAGAPSQSFIIEIVLTFVLMFTALQVVSGSKEKALYGGIAVGLVILIEAMFAGPITGASMNPTRSIAPAVVIGNYSHLWIYIFAPLIGALLAVFTFRYVKS